MFNNWIYVQYIEWQKYKFENTEMAGVKNV